MSILQERTLAKDLRLSPIETGIAGLDNILRGGLPPCNLYMLQGLPGAGKTTAVKILSTLISPDADSGELRVGGHDLALMIRGRSVDN